VWYDGGIGGGGGVWYDGGGGGVWYDALVLKCNAIEDGLIEGRCHWIITLREKRRVKTGPWSN